MGVDGIRTRFDNLAATAGSIGDRIRTIAADAAQEINDLFGNDAHPIQERVIQLLEQVAHIGVSHPTFQQPASEQSAARQPDPTTAGQQQPAPERTSAPGSASAPDSSSPPEPTSTGSAPTSSPTSTGGSTK